MGKEDVCHNGKTGGAQRELSGGVRTEVLPLQ